MDKVFERKYSVDVPKLRYGLNEEEFTVDKAFFEAFEFSPIQEGLVQAQVVIDKSSTHLDAKIHFQGEITLECDRCLEPYPHKLDFGARIVYSFDEELEFDTDEVVLIEESTPTIFFAQDFYDFIVLQIPIRRVPDASVHLCAPEVLNLLGMNPDGSPKEPEPVEEEEEEEMDAEDPRWNALKRLKDQEN